MMNRHFCCLLTLLVLAGSALADIKLPAIFSDHMVLKRSAKTPVWGKAAPGETVTVEVGGKSCQATAGEDGKWRVELDLSNSPPGPFEVALSGKNRVVIRDVVVGEVWLASGQSNMEFPLKGTIDSQAEIAGSANPLLRQFLVAKKFLPAPAEECAGQWTVAGPEASGTFSGVGYYFGKALQKELRVPVGIIHSSQGGTRLELWASPEAIGSVEKLRLENEADRKAQADYPAKKQAFVSAFAEWLKAHGREDKPSAGVPKGPFTTENGWSPVMLPSKPGKETLGCGAFWIHKEVNLPASAVGQPFRINLGDVRGFDSVYLNGEKIAGTSYETYPGFGFRRYYPIPMERQKEGANSIDIRIYAPAEGAALLSAPAQFYLGAINLAGEWLLKREYELPPPDAPAPQAPVPARDILASAMYNGMIAPLTSYALSGVIWYQGEANSGRAYGYRVAFPMLINDWRKKWNADLPFYFCQLANYGAKTHLPAESDWSELREAQSMTLSLPKTGQAVLIDVGEADDIHPRNKADVGERLARIALAKDYGKAIAFSGPVYSSMAVEAGKIRLKFTHLEGGLVARPLPPTYPIRTLLSQTAPLVPNSPGSDLEGFAICGGDRNWVWADAKIDGDSVLVWSDKVKNPAAVRYAWADNPTCNLYNAAGLPASPFRTDDFPGRTAKTVL